MTAMSRNERKHVFAYLADCGPLVKLSTGAVINGQVHHDYVVVHEAPPRVVREIVNNFSHVSLSADGLMIQIAPAIDVQE
jgi:hypothetical protein